MNTTIGFTATNSVCHLEPTLSFCALYLNIEFLDISTHGSVSPLNQHKCKKRVTHEIELYNDLTIFGYIIGCC